MAISNAVGFPEYSGNIVPSKIWSKKILVKFYEATVFSEIANTDYEGEIKGKGDSVEIRTTPKITTSPYNKGQNLNIQRPDVNVVTLNIDKARYWNYVDDDATKGLSDLNYINDWAVAATNQMKVDVDSECLAAVYADAHKKNKGATAGINSGDINLGATGAPILLDKTNIIDYLLDAKLALLEQNVPEEDCWAVLPSWATNMLKKSDLKDANMTGDKESILRNGRIGMIDGMPIYRSNLLPVVSDGGFNVTNILVGHKSALTFASAFTNSESLRAESTFGTIYRGLQVYGIKTVKPEALSVLYARKG